MSSLKAAVSSLPHRTALTIAAFGVFAAALRFYPTPPPAAAVPAAAAKTAAPQAASPVTSTTPSDVNISTDHLTVPAGSLDTFFAALSRTAAKEPGAVTRILHYGDSPTTADSITADVRRLLQRQFGNAGHGFVLIAKPWAWYGHSGITLDAKGWRIEPASQSRAADRFHGLGGVSFRGEEGATSRVQLADNHHTAAVVYYVAEPDGGTFTVSAGDRVLTEVTTAAEEKAPAFAEFALPPETGTIELRVTKGRVRLFGYRFDRDQPGVQYSSLGVNGAQVQMMDRYFEPGQWATALQHENPDLVVLNYGTNESVYPEYIEKQYPDDLRTALKRIRQALPRTSILVMSPMDRGVMEGGDIVTPPVLARLIEVQKQVAEEQGCAFFNTFEAMGGAGTMERWYHAQPRLVSADFMHPLPQGAAKVGALFETALVSAYAAANGLAEGGGK